MHNEESLAISSEVKSLTLALALQVSALTLSLPSTVGYVVLSREHVNDVTDTEVTDEYNSHPDT